MTIHFEQWGDFITLSELKGAKMTHEDIRTRIIELWDKYRKVQKTATAADVDCSQWLAKHTQIHLSSKIIAAMSVEEWDQLCCAVEQYANVIKPLFKQPPMYAVTKPTCTCGAASLGTAAYATGHSTWCDVYESAGL